MKKLLKKFKVAPRVIITYKLKSYGSDFRKMDLGIEHRQHKGLNKQTENSHQWTRLREGKMKGFKSSQHAQRFFSAEEVIYQHTQPLRHKLLTVMSKELMLEGIKSWKETTGILFSKPV